MTPTSSSSVPNCQPLEINEESEITSNSVTHCDIAHHGRTVTYRQRIVNDRIEREEFITCSSGAVAHVHSWRSLP